MTNKPNSLRVLRSGGSPSRVDDLAGYSVRVPRLDLAAANPFDDAPSRSGTEFHTVDATALVEPSRWERRYVRWLTEQSNAAADFARSPASSHPLSIALCDGGDWSGPNCVPDGVRVRRAATRRGEARAVGRDIRLWLTDQGLEGPEAAKALDDVLVLLPSRAEAFALWHREFDELGIPTRSHHFEPIGLHSVGRWLVSLAGLQGWEDEPVSRDTLRSILEAPFWSQSAVHAPLEHEPSLRKQLRKLLIGIRRDSFRYGDWRAHFEDLLEGEARQAVLEFSGLLLDSLRIEPGFFGGLLHVLRSLDVRQSIRARGDDIASMAFEKCVAVLRDLEYAERANGGVHPELESSGVVALLEEALRHTWMRVSVEQRHGVRLVAYDAYDGSDSALLFATGLGEGDYPVVPRKWNSTEEERARELGLLRDGETVEDYIHAELERQLRLVVHAVERCSGDLVLSFSSEGPGTEKRYPGPLLSLLVGGWSEEDWLQGAEQVEVFEWGDEIPGDASEALSWDDVALFAEHPRFRMWARKLEAEGELSLEDARRLREILEARGCLDTSRLAFRERFPGADEEPRFGAFSGVLPGGTESPTAFSASALESYGQCGTKYFFGKVLRVSDTEELGESLEPTETGTIIHAAFARAAHEVVDISQQKLWSMCVEPGETKEDAVDRILDVVDEHLEETVRAFLSAQASLSEDLVNAVVARWSGAIRKWAESHVVPRLPGTATEKELARDAKVKKYRGYRDQCREAAEAVERLREGLQSGEITTQSAATGLISGRNHAVTNKHLVSAYKAGDVSEIQAKVEAKTEEVEIALAAHEERVRERCRRHFNRDVAHGELAFGLTRDDADPSSSDEPVDVFVEELTVPVHGQVDRIDWDTDRGQFAVRDFKSGRRKNLNSLKRQIAAGEHLQLPLYSMAVEELARQGRLPHLKETEAVEVSLEFPRDPPSEKRHATELRLDDQAPYELYGRETTWEELSRTWLGSHVRNIEGGNFPLYPGRCPIEGTGYCDFERCCGYTAEFGRRATDPRRRPEVEEVVEDDAKTRVPCPDVLMPACTVTQFDDAAMRRSHERASKAASAVTEDVAVAAGAGTGKTYNLVLRYLSALADGAHPNEILCITFTRRAAAEMKSRIREALLSEPVGPQRPYVEALKSDPESFRRLLLSLSAAPITTIDALAGSIFREARAAVAAEEGRATHPLEVVTDQDVADQLRTFVRQKFLASIEAGDRHLHYLATRLDPIDVRDLLMEASKRDLSEELAALETLEERIEYLRAGWYRIMQPAADQLLAAIRQWPVDEFQDAFDDALAQTTKADSPNEDGAAWMRRFIETLRSGKPLQGEEAWSFLDEVLNGAVSQKRFGKTGLTDLLRDCKGQLQSYLEFYDPERWKAVKEWTNSLNDVDEFARTAAHATFVAQEWAEGFRAYLLDSGRVRFSDVEVLATEALEDPETAAWLGTRFPFQHIFLDEAQDTSYSQLRLIQGVRQMAQQATGEPCRQFVVGDAKQSIYAFRGAEVDVFMKRVQRGAENFTVNRRSTPTLLRAFNGLFDALFGAEARDGTVLDPRARVPFEPLTWPDGAEESEEAAIEVFTAPADSWFPTEESDEESEPVDDDEEEEESPVDVLEATPLQRGLAVRIGELVEEYPPGPRGASIAVLIGSWRRADFYRDLLDAYGIEAAVQGGRGLLNAPEVDGLLQWLEALAFPNRHTSFLGCLRGPGISISDAGLYCLRMGHGVEGLDRPAPHSIKAAALYGSFSARDAVRAWSKSGELDEGRAAPLLQYDEENLQRFRALWNGQRNRLGIEAPSTMLARLADELGLWTFWHPRPGGRQAVANLRSFLDLVRDLEANLGQDPWVILRRLDEMRGNSDPAAGGLDASGGAPVVITTYWQAKGLEWPVVVLPDVEKTKVRTSPRGLGDNRICIVDEDFDVVHTPEIRVSKPEKPMKTLVTAVTHALDQYRKPAQRAEIRRLLYVAMTRAKRKVVLSGTFDVPTTSVPDEMELTTLNGAKDWGTTLRVCLGLHLDDGAFRMDAESPWSDLHENGRILLIDGEEYGESTVGPTTRHLPDLPDVGDSGRWSTIPSTPVELIRPSDRLAETIPEVSPDLSTPLPSARHIGESPFEGNADQGSAFHLLMERTAYVDDDLQRHVQPVLEELKLDLPAEQIPARTEALLELARNALDHPLADQLREAAERGELYHELPLEFLLDDEHRVYGVIDVVWRDRQGRYHVIDYKTGAYPTADEPESDKLREHYAQTELYATGLERCGFDVGTFGVWYVAGEAVLRWGREGTERTEEGKANH